jgi:hypothetical protein
MEGATRGSLVWWHGAASRDSANPRALSDGFQCTGMSDLVEVPLHEIAHGRTGGKGNCANCSIIAYTQEAYPLLVRYVTEARVREIAARRGASAITRYKLPNL